MAPTKRKRLTHRQAEIEQFEARTEADPLGAVQPETEAEFTADGRIPRGQESSTDYVERIGRKPGAKPRR